MFYKSSSLATKLTHMIGQFIRISDEKINVGEFTKYFINPVLSTFEMVNLTSALANKLFTIMN